MENSACAVSFREIPWIGINLVEKWNYSGIADNASITPIMLSRVTSFSSSASLKPSVPSGAAVRPNSGYPRYYHDAHFNVVG